MDLEIMLELIEIFQEIENQFNNFQDDKILDCGGIAI